MIDSTHDINFKPSSSAPQIKIYISRLGQRGRFCFSVLSVKICSVRARKERGRFISFFYFFAFVLFEKAVYLVYLTAGQLAVIKNFSFKHCLLLV